MFLISIWCTEEFVSKLHHISLHKLTDAGVIISMQAGIDENLKIKVYVALTHRNGAELSLTYLPIKYVKKNSYLPHHWGLRNPVKFKTCKIPSCIIVPNLNLNF